jgi:hypothetical protein
VRDLFACRPSRREKGRFFGIQLAATASTYPEQGSSCHVDFVPRYSCAEFEPAPEPLRPSGTQPEGRGVSRALWIPIRVSRGTAVELSRRALWRVPYAESSSCTFATVEARTVARIYYPRH